MFSTGKERMRRVVFLVDKRMTFILNLTSPNLCMLSISPKVYDLDVPVPTCTFRISEISNAMPYVPERDFMLSPQQFQCILTFSPLTVSHVSYNQG